MPEQLPYPLVELLSTNDPEAQQIAWERFVTSYSGLLLRVARSMAHGYDAAMDRYTFILERLQDHDYERLRRYAVQPRSTFTTWLVVVARRLCLDFYRHQYGRIDGRAPPARSNPVERAARRRLMDDAFDSPDALAQVASKCADPATEFDLADRRRLLDAAIASLAPADRLLLKLRFEDDLPARTIAAVLDCRTEFHVYRRLRVVLGLLRERLDAAGMESPRTSDLHYD